MAHSFSLKFYNCVDVVCSFANLLAASRAFCQANVSFFFFAFSSYGYNFSLFQFFHIALHITRRARLQSTISEFLFENSTVIKTSERYSFFPFLTSFLIHLISSYIWYFFVKNFQIQRYKNFRKILFSFSYKLPHLLDLFLHLILFDENFCESISISLD